MKKRRIKKKVIVFFLFFVLFPILVVFAKYVYRKAYDFYLKSKEFYFTSSYMKVESPTFIIDNWDGLDYQLSIDVSNIENDDVWTGEDINYDVEVECSEQVTCSLSSASSDTLVYSSLEGTNNVIDLTIISNRELEEKEEVTVKVKATSTYPYKKEISATFTFIVGIYGIEYEVVDEENQLYSFLIIKNHLPNSQNLTISFDSTLFRIDNNNQVVSSSILENQYTLQDDKINSITFDIGGNDEVAINLYKEDITQNYSYPDIERKSVVTVSSN